MPSILLYATVLNRGLIWGHARLPDVSWHNKGEKTFTWTRKLKGKVRVLGVMIYMSHPFLFNERFTDYDEKKKKKMWEWRSSFVNAFSFPLFGQVLQGKWVWLKCPMHYSRDAKKLSIFRECTRCKILSQNSFVYDFLLREIRVKAKQLFKKKKEPEILVREKRGKNIKDWWILVKVRRRVDNPVSGLGLENALVKLAPPVN